VWPVGRGGQRVADLSLAVGDDDAVDERFGQLPPLGDGGGVQPGPDGLAETLDPLGGCLEFEPLFGGGLQLPLWGGQGVVPAVQLWALALEVVPPGHAGQAGIQQPLLLAV